MGSTITEKILAAHCGKKIVEPGEFIEPKVDIALSNDVTAPLAVKEFRKSGVKKVFDKNKIALVMDHFTPNKDILSAEHVKFVREFTKEQKIKHYYEGGDVGVEHAILPEKGIVVSGDVVIGADSHTCTYGALGAFSTGVGSTDIAAAMATGKVWFKVPNSLKFVLTGRLNKWVSGKDIILYIIGLIGVDGALYNSMEFTGPVCKKLNMADRFTIANMVIEAGGKNGIFTPDEITEKYVAKRALKKYKFYTSDKDAKYLETLEIDCYKILPQVAMPFLPSNTKAVKDVKKTYIDQVVIGSCTNGRIEDLRIAAAIIKKGKKVNPNIRTLIIPATPQVYSQALEEGLLKIFIDAGAIISAPTCGPCLGGHMGILASGEKCVSTTNRNFVGRMGHVESQVFLANPAVAAASAIKGYIALPDEI
ncbi:3-isopropylmalate dehydratase large subunit [Endomicrobiia bacterium]|nr:3-isopropylmalate dehydratase large subunit [Endomicrobiia bacterium]GHT65691.1 3-isopropylmalate dehydratase large subunit [Endomicrobiia bacterium]GHT71640.1 3-isopropylmalate dehydratase large subunit [Endomicrobiia bacterium]GHT75392.1 3-isopropylmalate dehydratase large subunit [Endomicrobiia bacterium]